ncbi:hypothetical protein GGD54_002467 [Rhizobium tropici]|uniref:Uncharacterized protein n=1 Tax=Rhizobium tropici TaxID=398 RepID=A0ABR6QYP9_RHITR|nr:hypothetical protein [Rhizobium tropici]MBB5593615.1 hypothetical protein [Rhizobium tropici]MBB6492063.1 hypothetical protein [Rhizobium tropici]
MMNATAAAGLSGFNSVLVVSSLGPIEPIAFHV